MTESDDFLRRLTSEGAAWGEELAANNDIAKVLLDLTEELIERVLSPAEAKEFVWIGFRWLEESKRRASGEERD